MCRSYAPLTICRARSLGRTSCSVRVAIELEPNALPLPTARASRAALAVGDAGLDAELEQQVARRIHLVDPAGRVLSTACQEPVEQRLADDAGDLAA